jgi:hypothetical protein
MLFVLFVEYYFDLSNYSCSYGKWASFSAQLLTAPYTLCRFQETANLFRRFLGVVSDYFLTSERYERTYFFVTLA